ncbi:MAG: hypothetical protein KIT42_00775 [Rhodocyclaceae bacterium]|nr:hypothetical protein [Rhodocyclaceae bacterium]MCB1892480.1 hypothetical protein [Rhodocyclaceae bacterium]MCW5594379.1 hypothetical protein [Rhodocyclaceae bacterium]
MTTMLQNHVKIGSAILNRDYFWSMACDKCKALPEVHFRPTEASPTQQLHAKRPDGTGSHVFDQLSPGLYCLKNFCGGGFRFDAKVSVTDSAIAILHLQGTSEV